MPCAEYNYKLNCSEYVLHCGNTPIGALLQEVAVAFDKDSGTLFKHGDPALVEKWYQKTVSAYRSSGLSDMADSIVVIQGRFKLDDLNKCLTHTGYAKVLYEGIQAGTLQMLDIWL